MDYERRHFEYLARYNRAANEAMVAHLAALEPGAIGSPRGSFFGSIQGILDHLITCDINWLRRFRELYPDSEPLCRPRLSPPGCAWTNFSFPDFDEFRRERAAVDAIIVDWIAGAEVSRFGDALSYADSHGNPMRYLLCEAVDHFFNHQTHHRGQVSQILDELGVKHDYSNLIGVAQIPED
jgi:uncharacterized damage-inducible protein DinB